MTRGELLEFLTKEAIKFREKPNFISINKHLTGIDENGNAKCYFAYDSEDGFREGKYHFIGRATNCKPATKEQSDLLFQKMKEAGYEWDADEKKLKKIEQKPAETEKGAKGNEREIPNSAWSEEDEDYYDAIIAKLEVTQDDALLTDNQMEFLKSLKDRVHPQPKQEWSKEDERIRIETIELLETANHPNVLHRNGKPLDFTENINWLKSLRSQSQWKPSEEQMKALDIAIRCGIQLGSWEEEALKSLKEQLKKLREE